MAQAEKADAVCSVEAHNGHSHPNRGLQAMNRSSYRKLLANGKAALLAAIEIYNKPRIDYRDECFVILLLNAWELIMKAILSKDGQTIFYPKVRGQAYRTYSLADAFRRAEKLLSADLSTQALRMNLELLGTYRDNSVHFYNARSFGAVIYALAQTSIVNLKDLLKAVFDIDLSDEISWQLLPLGLNAPVDPIDYISGKGVHAKQSSAVKQFLAQIANSTQLLEAQKQDTGRLLTIFKVKLESTKKIVNADVVVGVEKAADGAKGPLVVTRNTDPNETHPLLTMAVVKSVGTLHGFEFTSGAFQAIAWKYGLKANPMLCWKSKEGNLIRYSRETVAFVKRLTQGDVRLAKTEYRERNRRKRVVVPATATLPLGANQTAVVP
jgi:EC042_2821-lke REase/Protein of unknown function (DUF3644)